MDKYLILLGYFDKQMKFIDNIYHEIVNVDVSVYEKRYLFALKTQQIYTALEDLFKQIAKSFENHIEELAGYHKGLLLRMEMEIPNKRPSVLSKQSFLILDKIRAFRHFIRHAYDCELDEVELKNIQEILKKGFSSIVLDLNQFRSYINELGMP